MPAIPDGYGVVKESGDLGSTTTGVVKAHTHTVTTNIDSITGGGGSGVSGMTTGGDTTSTSSTSSTGGSANLPAGLKLKWIIKT